MQNPSAPPIFLASSSPYRRSLLNRFLDQYEVVSPEVDESNEQGLAPDELAPYLARKKAEAIAINARDALVIGADQVAVLEDKVLGKPGTHAKAIEQLLAASGKTVTFLTAVCILDPVGRTGPLFVSASSTAAWPRPTCATMSPTTAPAVSNSKAQDSSCLNPCRRTTQPVLSDCQ